MALQTISLNGTWEVVFDPSDQGKKRKYHARLPKGKPIAVPGIWETVRPFYNGVGWYSTCFKIKPAWKHKVLRLRFGAANYFAEAWLNGRYLGTHEGGYTPFVFDISAQARTGDNRLTVRVIDPPRDRPIQGFRTGAPLSQTDIPTWKAGWYYNFGGLWQDVELVVTDKVYVDDVFVEPSFLRKRVTVHVYLKNKSTAQKGRLTIRAFSAEHPRDLLFTLVKPVAIGRGLTEVSITRSLKKFIPWDCENPHLYILQLELATAAGGTDTFSVRFGIRDFHIKGGHLFLNNKRIVLKGFLQQGVYPKTIAFPHNRAMARHEMALVKRNGYNYLRMHIKPAPPQILDLADEMGILLSAEPPLGWIERTEQTARRCRSEVHELVKRDRNHPSIVFWCVFNEAYHYRTFTLKQVLVLTDQLMRIARRLDPTRLVIGNSGGSTGGDYTTESLFPYSSRVQILQDAHAYFGASQHGLKRYRTAGKPGLVLINSEFGALEAPMDFKGVLGRYTPAEKRLGLEEYVQYHSYYRSLEEKFRDGGLSRIFKDLDTYIKAADQIRRHECRLMVGAMRSNPRWDCIAFCQLADASGEIFGATDLWRKPKAIFTGLTEASITPYIVPFIDPRVFKKGDTFHLNVKVVNEHMTGKKYRATTEIVKPGQRPVARFTHAFTSRQWVDDILAQKLTVDFGPGRYQVRTTLYAGSRAVAANQMALTVLPDARQDVSTVVLFDMDKRLAPVFNYLDYQVITGSNNYRYKHNVNLFSMDLHSHPGLLREVLGQVKRIVQLGGVVILLEPPTPLLYDQLFPRVIRRAYTQRDLLYVHDHPIFQGLPKKCLMDYEYDSVRPHRLNDPYDVKKLGGRIICGSLSSHMWTNPDVYFWGSAVDIIPVGRGNVITCNLNLLNNLRRSRTAQNLLVNLVNYAHTLIKPGYEEKLLNRCIDQPVV